MLGLGAKIVLDALSGHAELPFWTILTHLYVSQSLEQL